MECCSIIEIDNRNCYQKVVKFDDVLGLSTIYGIIKALIILLQELDNTIPDLTLVIFHI